MKEFSKIFKDHDDADTIIIEAADTFVNSLERPGSAVFKMTYRFSEKYYDLHNNVDTCINEDDFKSLGILSSLG